jgi:hypothetical protein
MNIEANGVCKIAKAAVVKRVLQFQVYISTPATSVYNEDGPG